MANYRIAHPLALGFHLAITSVFAVTNLWGVMKTISQGELDVWVVGFLFLFGLLYGYLALTFLARSPYRLEIEGDGRLRFFTLLGTVSPFGRTAIHASEITSVEREMDSEGMRYVRIVHRRGRIDLSICDDFDSMAALLKLYNPHIEVRGEKAANQPAAQAVQPLLPTGRGD